MSTSLGLLRTIKSFYAWCWEIVIFRLRDWLFGNRILLNIDDGERLNYNRARH